MNSVPEEIALQICAELQEESRRQWYNPMSWQCWGCMRFSNDDRERMCGCVVECNRVVARYTRRMQGIKNNIA